MPIASGGQFYTPRPGPAGWQGSELYDWMAELERSSYFGNWLGKQGLQGIDQASDVGRSLENRFQQGYEAELIDDPEFKWQDYLEGQRPHLQTMMAGMDPGSRGYSPGTYTGQGNARWLPRSR